MAVANSPTMKIATPLGNDLLFHRMAAREELGRLGEFEIDLLSPRGDIKPNEILAKNVTVTLELPGEAVRYFNGYVTRFHVTGMRGRYHLYHASVRPWLWFLTRTADCRIFSQMTVPEIIQKVFDDHSVADVELALSASYAKRDYTVQYRETDFNFLSRLMEREGIYYYLKHKEGRHTLVLTDSASGHSPFEGYGQIPFIPQARVRPEQEAVTQWSFGHEVQTGANAMNDYNFTAPAVDRNATRKAPHGHDHAEAEVYDYPGEYLVLDEGKSYVHMRLEEVHAQYALGQGTTNARGLCTGSTFKLKGYGRRDQVDEYLVVAANHDLEYSEYESMEGGGSSYGCTFTAMPSHEPFRSRRLTPEPVIQGPQTAVVVGPSGDEIYTDEYGRVKVQFHWDRLGKKDENSSCWMRVAQPWAGNNWGATFIPRIGQEVVVSFLEGDPDRPLVTGSVYNAIQQPPYLGEGRDEKHKNDPNLSGIKTNSTKGGSGYNELRFDDTAGKEQVFIHGQFDMDTRIENDERHHVGNDQHRRVIGNVIEKIDKSAWLEIVTDQSNTIGGDKAETIVKNHDLLVKVDQNAEVKGTASLTVGKDLQEKVTGDAALDAKAIHLKAGTTVIIEAGTQISLKVGGNFIDIGPSGVTIVGTMVLINSGGSAGSGGGSSPTAAKEAEKKEVAEADTSASGSKSAPG
ncbi:MAG TPA: type VI secretion system tip protein TssI/VgrG [Burkholderiales bacterium]|nr:type VI secretion system tip protein TssI/VgrG [Burkholderiales bacterium]